jgi:hypothetical protein
MTILMMASASAVLEEKFSEDFESYPTLNTTWVSGSSAWMCGDNSEGTCVFSTGSPPNVSGASQYIKDEGGNKHLHMVSTGGDENDYHWSSLRGNFSSVATVQQNWSAQWDYRLWSVDWGAISTWQYSQRYYWAGMDLSHFGDFWWSTYQGLDLGTYGGWNTAQTQANWTQFRYIHTRSSHPAENWPLNGVGWNDTTQAIRPECVTSDGAWHRITVHFEYNSTLNQYDDMWLYIDGTLCAHEHTRHVNPATTIGIPAGQWKMVQPWALGGVSADFDNIKVYYDYVNATSYPEYECDDGADNDGDGFIDYPNDPSCSGITDDSEAPYDGTECADTIDNDGDGFTDYPDDPSCTSLLDDDESPRDDSPAEEDDCLVEEGCLLHDTIPYSDELNLHGWYGDTGSTRVVNAYGSYKIYLDTDSDTVRFNMSKNITNTNVYDTVNSDADIYMDVGGVGILFNDDNYTFYWEHLDYDDNLVNSIMFNLSRVSSFSQDFIKVLMYNYNGTEYVQFGNTLYPAQDSGSRVQFFLTIDQTLKTYDVEYLEYGESIATVSDLPWANVLANKIHKVRFKDVNSINDSMVDVYIDDLSIYSDDVSYDTVCTEWVLPYYLRESFDGYPQACDWSSNLNIFFTGKYKLYDTTSLYQQFKELPTHIKDENTKYATIEFDAEFDDFGEDGSTYVRLYDDDYQLFFTILMYEGSGDVTLAYQEDGNNEVAQTGIPMNQTFTYKAIIDFDSDTYEVYFNDTLVESSAGFYEDFYNLQEIGFVRIGSTLSDVEIDNFDIYASDEDGFKVIPDDDDGKEPTIDSSVTMCGLVHTSQPSCSEDADCDSGYCLPNNKCARWDAEYCAENGMVYGNKCFLAGTFDCALTGAGNLVLDNFFLFLILLVLVMLAVYLVIMFRR